MKRKIVAFFVLALMLFQITASAEAPAKSYIYDITAKPVLAPDAMYFDRNIDTQNIKDASGKSIGRLNNPSDLFIDKNKNIYIVDTDNNRVIVLNKDYSLNKIIKEFTGKDGKISAFSVPMGVFVDKDLNVYIADQQNARIVELDKNDKVVRIIGAPKSPVLDNAKGGFTYKPSKLTIDAAGRIFVISTGCNLGVIELDKDGNFVKVMGAPRVVYNLVDLLWRTFSSAEARKTMINYVPTEYVNINIDSEDFIYVVTNTGFSASDYNTVGPVKKLNAKGLDVLRAVGKTKPYGDAYFVNYGTYAGPSHPGDVLTLDYGMYAIMDETRSRVFFYSNDGELMFEIGAPPDNSDFNHKAYTKGSIEMPRSIAWLDGSCLVLDKNLKSISVFTLTQYGKMIIEANMYHKQNKYDKEAELWAKIYKLNNNNFSAKQNLGKVAYRNRQYVDAMKYFKESEDKVNYSNAYKYARRDAISNNFTLGVVCLGAFIALLIIGMKLRKKYLPPIEEFSYLGYLKYSTRVIFRPLNSYWSLVREKHSSVAAAITIVAGACIMTVLQARFTGFVFSTQRAENINLILEILKIVAPVLLFCICNWCVTSLLNGEGNFRAIFIGTSYALTPIILLYPIAIVLSNVMVLQEGDFYTVFITIAMIWVTMLIVAGNMRIHDFTLFKAICVLLLTILVMMIVVFLGVLFFALMQQVLGFIGDIGNELSNRS